MAWREKEEAIRARVVALVRAGDHDTTLYTRPNLNRQQLGYLCALLELRLATYQDGRYQTDAERAKAVTGALGRVQTRERTLSGLHHGGTGGAGIDHLLDYLGEIVAEHDIHGLWDEEGAR